MHACQPTRATSPWAQQGGWPAPPRLACHKPGNLLALCCAAPQENSDIESLPEDARTLLLDKDTLMNALQVGVRPTAYAHMQTHTCMCVCACVRMRTLALLPQALRVSPRPVLRVLWLPGNLRHGRMQASHEAHTVKIDTLEDRLVNTELKSANDLVTQVRAAAGPQAARQPGPLGVLAQRAAGPCLHPPIMLLRAVPQNYAWAVKRNRDRISEIINYVERNMIELDELAGDEDMGDQ